MESALSFYQLIPEAVFQLTSLSTRKTNNFHNHLGSFRYQTIHRSLFSKTTSDFTYLSKNADIQTKKDLIERLEQKASHLDLKILAKDIEPFLFDPSQKDRVLYFKNWLTTLYK